MSMPPIAKSEMIMLNTYIYIYIYIHTQTHMKIYKEASNQYEDLYTYRSINVSIYLYIQRHLINL